MNSRSGRNPRVLILAAMTALAVAPSRAGEGRIPIHEPVVITVPGSYIVTRDITSTTGPIVDIQVGGVSLNLDGHTITVSNSADPVVRINSVLGVEPEPFRIANGTIAGGMDGISATAAIAPCVRVFQVNLSGQGQAAIRIASLGDLEAKGIIVVDTRTAFDLTGPSPTPDGKRPTAVIADSILHADVGVSCAGVNCRVLQNSFATCGTGIRLVDAEGSEATGNIFSVPGSNVCFNPQPEPPGDVIHVEASPGVQVRNNTIHGSPAATGANHGITADTTSHDALIADNVITGFGDDGMHLMSSGNVIRDNLVNRNTGNGIWVGGMDSLLECNKITANTGDGIVFNGIGNAYRGNVLPGNNNPVSGTGLADTIDGGGNIQ